VHDPDGTPLTASFLDYELPTIDQAPEIEVELLELPSELGPLGAKGVGEPPAIPGPAAVAAAIRDATGVRPMELPFRGPQSDSRRPNLPLEVADP
jgi:CO/xanthine dehydrogenase Mo-binding subunit